MKQPPAWRTGPPPGSIDEELAYHFERVVEELMQQGESREAAEAEARRRFGDAEKYRRDLERIDRAARVGRLWRSGRQALAQSFVTALRSIRRSPGLSAGIILAFALGIGANATMFGIVDRLLLSPPAHIADPDAVHRIVVNRLSLGERVRTGTVAIGDYEDLLAVPQFAGVAAYSQGMDRIVGRGESARTVKTLLVTGSYWRVLGVRPALGRFFTEEEDRPGGLPVAVLGYSLWQRMYRGAPGVLGQIVDFGFGPYTIIGVAPRGFTGVELDAVDLWAPALAAGATIMGKDWVATGQRHAYWLHPVVRLAPGATAAAAEAAATGLHRAGRREDIARGYYDAAVRIEAAPLIAARDPDGPKEARVAAWLAGVSAIVLLIACVNVANLQLARAIRQRRETGIRLAMGISRARLAGQTLVESVLLAGLGGLAALVITRWGGDVVRRVLLPDVAWTDHGWSARGLLFLLVLCLLTGVLSGLVPAFTATRRSVADVLRTSSGGIARSTNRVRTALSMAQAALSVVLLVGAGLFVRSLGRVQSMDLGFDMKGLLTAEPVADASSLSGDQKDRFYAAAAELLAQQPGVRSAAFSGGVPFWFSFATDLRIPGRDSLPTPPSGGPYVSAISRDYFRTMDLRLLSGRDFQPAEFNGKALVVVVNQALANLFWPDGKALGACLIIGSDTAPCSTVVGVVENARRSSLIEQPSAQYYVPMGHAGVQQQPRRLFFRTTRTDATFLAQLRAALLALEPRLRYVIIQPLSDLAETQLRSWKLGAAMFSVFGLLALVVATLGLYSVLAFDVAQRTREIGLRSALGAGTRHLLGIVGASAVRVTVLGLAIGLGVALLLAPRVRDLLYNTSPYDPPTLAAVTLVLLLVAVLAGSVPAWRAARVDPNIALRAD